MTLNVTYYYIAFQKEVPRRRVWAYEVLSLLDGDGGISKSQSDIKVMFFSFYRKSVQQKMKKCEGNE